MRKFNYFYLILFLLIFTNEILFAQGINISGTVTDNEGSTLPGVSVVVKGTTTGTGTDMNGHYTLNASKGSVLVFSYIGYGSQEVQVENQTRIDITLLESALGLDEIVVVGYGTQSRRTITSAITKVDGKVLENIPITSVGEGLKGKIAGVRVHTSNNTPGSDASFTIRGGSSINKSNAPLILIDGIERPYSGINPNDIESIEVLKDAASTAVYGARASNGVVLISTRQGKRESAPRVTFDVNIANQGPVSKRNFMNARDYISTVRPAVVYSPYPQRNEQSGFSASSGNDDKSIYSTRYLNDGEIIPAGYQSMPDPLDPTRTLIFQDNNIQDLLYRNTMWQNYYVGVDGGSESIRYAASIGYLDDDGVARGTGYKRMSAKANTGIIISPKLNLNLGFDFARTTSNQFENQTYEIARALANPNVQKIYYDDGTPTPGYNFASPNPLWTEYHKQREDKNNLLSMFGELDYHIFDGLKASVQGSYYNKVYQFDSFEKANEFNGLRPVTSSFAEVERKKLDAYLSYIKSLQNRHNLSMMAGYSYQSTHNKEMSASANGGSSDKVPTLSAAPNKTAASSKFEDVVLIGYFGRLSYNYLQKYLFTATFRLDGSSLFADENRWGFFPGASAGWIMSEESFMKNIDIVNNLKWRLSFGQTGNNNVGLYDAVGGYSTTAPYNGNAGIIPSSMPNINLTWEKTTQLDIGFDIGFWNNRISLSADYFDKRTDNLLFSKELPNTTGFNSIQTNVGKVKFYGFDLEVNTENIKKKDFSWDSKIIFSFVKNKVLKLPDNGRDKNRIGGITLNDGTAFGGIAEGEPLYRYYGYVTDGILQNSEQAANALYDEQANGWNYTDQKRIKGRKSAGDYEWKDRDGDGKITSKDQFELGVTVPTTTGGLNNTFRYKDFSLNIFLDWALGHSINDVSYMRYFMNTFSYNYALADEVKNCWKQEGDNTIYARFVPDDPNDGNRNFTRTSDVFNYKGDYLCIRDVSLQYSIPRNIISRLGIYGLTVTLSGSNLHYFTAVKGVSPEFGTASTYDGYNGYPPVRRYAVGIKATF